MEVTINKDLQYVSVIMTKLELEQFNVCIGPINMIRYSRANNVKHKLIEALTKLRGTP